MESMSILGEIKIDRKHFLIFVISDAKVYSLGVLVSKENLLRYAYLHVQLIIL